MTTRRKPPRVVACHICKRELLRKNGHPFAICFECKQTYRKAMAKTYYYAVGREKRGVKKPRVFRPTVPAPAPPIVSFEP